jgi:ABC-type branched-subunit amino acid transport system permease subunit
VEPDEFAWVLPFAVFGLPAVLALFTALGFAIARALWSSGPGRILALAFGLGVSEWLRAVVATGFPWNSLGMALGGWMSGKVFDLTGSYHAAFLNGVAWNLLGGYAGQVSLGHAAFYGIGAYTSTMLLLNFGLNPWWGVLLGGLTAAALSLLFGWSCFRLKGHYFAMATIAVAELVQILFTNWDYAGSAVGLTIPMTNQGWAAMVFATVLYRPAALRPVTAPRIANSSGLVITASKAFGVSRSVP